MCSHGNKQRQKSTLSFSKYDIKDRRQAAHEHVLSLATRTRNAPEQTKCSSCSNGAKVVRAKEARTKPNSRAHIDGKKPATSFTTSSKNQQRSSPLRESRGVKVCRSALATQGAIQTQSVTESFHPESSRCPERRTDTSNTSCCTQRNDSDVRRFALYRGMLKHSRLERDLATRKDRSKVDPIFVSNQAQDTNPSTSGEAGCARVHFPQETRPADDVTEAITSRSRRQDLIGVQTTKRIYIREIVNGAIIEEVVDVKNEGDWEILNYMTPLRHISSRPEEISQALRFQDLKDFNVYYYPHPWR